MSLASLMLFARTHKTLLGNIFVGLLLFVVGWQLGRVTSPYYASTPIIFEDRECSACSSSGGTTEELVALQQKGAGSDTQMGESAVAGTQNVDVQKSTENQNENAKGEFVGSVNSNKFHHVNCSTWKQIKKENQIWFSSVEDAKRAGYEPTKCTAELLTI